jgi:hypothetical protein
MDSNYVAKKPPYLSPENEELFEKTYIPNASFKKSAQCLLCGA